MTTHRKINNGPLFILFVNQVFLYTVDKNLGKDERFLPKPPSVAVVGGRSTSQPLPFFPWRWCLVFPQPQWREGTCTAGEATTPGWPAGPLGETSRPALAKAVGWRGSKEGWGGCTCQGGGGSRRLGPPFPPVPAVNAPRPAANHVCKPHPGEGLWGIKQ